MFISSLKPASSSLIQCQIHPINNPFFISMCQGPEFFLHFLNKIIQGMELIKDPQLIQTMILSHLFPENKSLMITFRNIIQ